MGALYGIAGAWNAAGTSLSVKLYTGRLNTGSIPAYKTLSQYTRERHGGVNSISFGILSSQTYHIDGMHNAAVKALNLDIWA